MGFRQPAKTKIGGKFLVYGLEGTGKSIFGLTFPDIAAIDSETGLGFYEDTDIKIGGKTYNNIKFIDTTSDLDLLEENLNSIIDGDVEGVNTLVIDSETKFYVSMDIGATEAEEYKAKISGKAVDTRAKWGKVKNINMKFQQAKITASAKGFHVVSVAQGKEITDDNTGKIIGYRPDAHKSLVFDYDIILRFYKVENKKTKEFTYFAEIEKDRTNVTKTGDIIQDCTYDVWKDYFDARNGLKTSGANFSQDLKNSNKSVLTEVELAMNLTKDIKEAIKALNTDQRKLVKPKLDELGIDIKTMDSSDSKVLKEALEFLKGL